MDFHDKLCVLVCLNAIKSSSTKQQQSFDATKKTCLYEKRKIVKNLKLGHPYT
jgi:hypothetical protein